MYKIANFNQLKSANLSQPNSLIYKKGVKLNVKIKRLKSISHCAQDGEISLI